MMIHPCVKPWPILLPPLGVLVDAFQSALESWNSAIEALKRWAMDPVAPKPPPKARDLGAHRRNSNRKRKAEIQGVQVTYYEILIFHLHRLGLEPRTQ